MTNKKVKNSWWLLLLLLLPALSGCNNADDVQKIFTGKSWKLSVIKFDNDKECKDYWVNGDGTFNEKAFKTSNKILMEKGTFTLTFTGAATGDDISGKASGKAYQTSITDAPWKANGKNNEFAMAVKTTTDKDPLAIAFLQALSTATSYSGDENNLYIYFNEGQKQKYLAFHVDR